MIWTNSLISLTCWKRDHRYYRMIWRMHYVVCFPHYPRKKRHFLFQSPWKCKWTQTNTLGLLRIWEIWLLIMSYMLKLHERKVQLHLGMSIGYRDESEFNILKLENIIRIALHCILYLHRKWRVLKESRCDYHVGENLIRIKR
jgi:hypothetical protein